MDLELDVPDGEEARLVYLIVAAVVVLLTVQVIRDILPVGLQIGIVGTFFLYLYLR